ncbi:serine/threonine protein kinase [Pedococcus dokdonensis]|uniref:non-specific serine/threonine protein kinase n=1 Tax=Pedococcus dokdonensis TaxID=443156 RepID=A0A1H0TMB1_9MICO|nr:protein kinase [Pedococcus dokdonensis]SDP54768.1 serine/threonine protein kinase [Pedococcus dokdonensis]
MTYEADTRLADRYRLVERIATGGMGEVWRAHDETLQRDVAVKVLRPDSAEDGAFVERFRAEARLGSQLTHPNVGTVHDFGEQDGQAFLVMELMAGEPLSTLIRDRAPMPQAEVTEILHQIALALQAAHDAGVVHRDVKPANIVVDEAGYAKLTDFGIARALGEASMTQTGEVLGTPHYLAPEQAKGETAGPLSDVYALAVVGYEMLTGQRPFSGESMVATALAHVSQPAPQLSDEVDDPLRTTVMAALAKDPGLRPQSAGEFADALRLAPGRIPWHLSEGAAAAVTPVIVGVPADLPPDQPLPTSVLPAVADAGGSDDATSEHDTRRPGWLIPACAALVVMLAVVSAMALGGRSQADTPSSTPQDTTPATTTVATTPHTATATATTAKATTSVPTSTTKPAKASPAPAPHKKKGPGAGKGGRKK